MVYQSNVAPTVVSGPAQKSNHVSLSVRKASIAKVHMTARYGVVNNDSLGQFREAAEPCEFNLAERADRSLALTDSALGSRRAQAGSNTYFRACFRFDFLRRCGRHD